jgi:dolichol kinase
MSTQWKNDRPENQSVTPAPEPLLSDSHNIHRQATIDYRSELFRKGIHLVSLSIPIIYYSMTRELALTILLPLTAAFLIVDLTRYYHTPTAEWFYRWFGSLLRKHEQDSNRKRLNGATNVLLSACLCVFIFPKIVTVNAFAVLIISDTTSALIGRRFGKRPFLNKSWEGAVAFFLSALVVVFVAPKVEGHPVEYLISVVAAAVAAVAESLSTDIDDNLSVPLTFGCVMWGLYVWLLPTMNISRVF